ncbi:hypothetical protein [Paenibacillus eucommiae]|uniref:DUF4829 domain-containing protein n=1 Tax=Paenibacillus eucommiae TaxID=1355755 RepID=A0ABS4IV94_9BACL|nr:hypothetical protein [Paenibacillus eucommiae]MBP1991512.1 hypothetical protein [Paenibacillus eucommiae]
MRYLLLLMIIVFVLVACQSSNEKPDHNSGIGLINKETPNLFPSEESDEIDFINVKPTYLDIDDYTGDEQAIVKVINKYIKAGYEGDFSDLPVLNKDAEDYSIPTFSKTVITQIKKVDFDNVPQARNNDTKYVVLEYVQVLFNPKGTKGIEYEEYQLFIFQKEDGEWKFVGSGDHWEGNI